MKHEVRQMRALRHPTLAVRATVIELSLRLPSLDEVFFALTHHEHPLAVAA